MLNKETSKCDLCLFFKKESVGVIELTWVTTRRYRVCEKHKVKMVESNKQDTFNRPQFAPELKFISNEEYDV